MERRSFLAAILAGAAAPAVVRASSLMKIVVPPEPVILLPGTELWQVKTPDEILADIRAAISALIQVPERYLIGAPVYPNEIADAVNYHAHLNLFRVQS